MQNKENFLTVPEQHPDDILTQAPRFPDTVQESVYEQLATFPYSKELPSVDNFPAFIPTASSANVAAFTTKQAAANAISRQTNIDISLDFNIKCVHL